MLDSVLPVELQRRITSSGGGGALRHHCEQLISNGETAKLYKAVLRALHPDKLLDVGTTHRVVSQEVFAALTEAKRLDGTSSNGDSSSSGGGGGGGLSRSHHHHYSSGGGGRRGAGASRYPGSSSSASFRNKYRAQGPGRSSGASGPGYRYSRR